MYCKMYFMHFQNVYIKIIIFIDLFYFILIFFVGMGKSLTSVCCRFSLGTADFGHNQ